MRALKSLKRVLRATELANVAGFRQARVVSVCEEPFMNRLFTFDRCSRPCFVALRCGLPAPGGPAPTARLGTTELRCVHLGRSTARASTAAKRCRGGIEKQRKVAQVLSAWRSRHRSVPLHARGLYRQCLMMAFLAPLCRCGAPDAWTVPRGMRVGA